MLISLRRTRGSIRLMKQLLDSVFFIDFYCNWMYGIKRPVEISDK